MDSDMDTDMDTETETTTQPTPTQPPPAVQPTTLYVAFDLGVWQAHDVQTKLDIAFGGKGMEYLPGPPDA